MQPNFIRAVHGSYDPKRPPSRYHKYTKWWMMFKMWLGGIFKERKDELNSESPQQSGGKKAEDT